MFEGSTYERLFILLLSLTDPDLLKESKYTDHHINIIRNPALEKLHRQRRFKKHNPVHLSD